MDEELSNMLMAEEQRRMERESKAYSRGCGLLTIIVAVIVALVFIIYSIVRL